RLGYSADTTRISVTLDGVQIATDASLSPANALNWQTRTTTFTGRGGTQTLRIASDARQIDRNGRGMMLDDIVLSETLPANTGREDSPIRLSAISAALRDTDGSETLTLSLEDLPVGSVLSDGSKRFTATADHSTVELTGWTLGQLSLTPAKDYHGRFTLQVVAIATEQANGTQARSQASLTVTVLPVNDAPTARDASYTVKQAGQIDLDLSMLIGDIDGDTLTLTLSSPCHGRLIKNPDGSYRYLPQRGFTGTERIAYTVSDGRLSSSAVLTLRVVPDEDEHCHLARPEGPERPQPAHGRAESDDAPPQPTPSPQRPSVGTPAIDWNGRAPDWKLAIARNWVADYFTTPKNTPRTLAEITGLVVKVER
ncbi:MAG TPA: Ig-like domain-containing protein, partial [Accumulibacter sp.]|uniref:Ig-like domain-containing protein n=1 Tax=Accumulibacter sp. TaxID=2053492 RepID=UPI002BA2AF38